jgi:DNA-binding NtrC family response regulator
MSNDKNLHILLVDDTDFLTGASGFLQTEEFDVSTAATCEDALELLRENPFDVAIIDTTGPCIDAHSLIREALSIYPGIVTIVTASNGTVEDAVRAMQNGAYDYLNKPFQPTELGSAINRAMGRLRQRQENAATKRDFTQKHCCRNIIGKSTAMQNVFELAETIAPSNSTVLITGETGTGKELVAQAIHAMSSRRDQKIVSINCGAIPENLLESELFGHVKGAFTGAHQTRIGRFEQAHKGTIFLDEIGNMSVNLQVKLLRVLQEREFERVGGFEKIKVDVRIIAATSANLKEMVARNEFRSDLFYRLNVIPMQMPPLRERREDVPLLTTHFIEKYCRNSNLDIKNITQEAMKILMNHNWPGNVRELENAVERAVAMISTRDTIVATDLPAEVQRTARNLYVSEIYIPDEGVNFNTEVSELERKLILESLKKTNGNKREAAELLQLKRTTLIEKLRRFNMVDDLETINA